MNLAFIFTNYNNSLLSLAALNSIEQCKGSHSVTIVIVDNASRLDEVNILKTSTLPSSCTIIYNPRNVGYFSGLNTGIDYIRSLSESYDLVIVGNNDLTFGPKFFNSLSTCTARLSAYPVICPDILTLDNVHQNPHVSSSISRLRELLWDLYYLNYTLSRFLLLAAQLTRSFTSRTDYQSHARAGIIYQGYGACYLLTPKFFAKYSRLWSPGFLMGEEFYLARQLAEQGDTMYYCPDLTVTHHDHATVSCIPSRKLWSYSREAHKIYRAFISPYRLRMDSDLTPSGYTHNAA